MLEKAHAELLYARTFNLITSLSMHMCRTSACMINVLRGSGVSLILQPQQILLNQVTSDHSHLANTSLQHLNL